MDDSSKFLTPTIPKFVGFYDHWAMLMENFLISKEYWKLVENGIMVAAPDATPGQRKFTEESKLKDLKAKNYLFQAIDQIILETILTRDTAKDIWDSMRGKYQGSKKVKMAQLLALHREFKVLCMKDNEMVDDYFARTLAIANKMAAQGDKME